MYPSFLIFQNDRVIVDNNYPKDTPPNSLNTTFDYISDKRHEKYKSSKRWFGAKDFKLDDRTGKLICPAGHGLYVKNRNFVTKDGYKAIAYQAPKTACRNCRLRSKCLRNPDTVSRQVHVFYGKRPGSITDEMKEKIDTEQGRKIYSKRLGIVEPVFGNIRSCKRMDKFTLTHV